MNYIASIITIIGIVAIFVGFTALGQEIMDKIKKLPDKKQ